MTDTNTPNTTQQAGTQPEGNGPAGKLFTQDEVNAIVQERLARERAKYADYNDLKAGAASHATELQQATDRANALQTQLDELNKAAALKAMRDRVAAATGCSADLLTGETEEDCTTQAKAIMEFARPGYPIVRDGGEPRHAPSVQDSGDAFSNAKKHTPKELWK